MNTVHSAEDSGSTPDKLTSLTGTHHRTLEAISRHPAAHHLTDYLQSHHHETYQRVVREIIVDLSSVTTPHLLELARQAFRG
jgi:hypothetical protein